MDGRIITADNRDSAPLRGRTLAAYLVNGASTTTVSFGTSFTSVSEGATAPVNLQLTRGGLIEHALVIRLETSGTANEHSDFLRAPQRLLFQPRQSSIVVEMTPIDDNIDEDDEDLFFELLGDPSYSLVAIGSALVSILDND